jgi:mevalonate kinase
MGRESFHSKILLFGEYSIIKDSMALCIPYSLFEGSLSFRQNEGPKIDPELKAFSQYFKKCHSKGHFKFDFDFDFRSFEFDISQGLFFDSIIPQGFGVGSSGALCAAIFSRYAFKRETIALDPQIIFKLKRSFASMESFFHGSSSGFDPLISYLNKAVLIKGKDDLEMVDIPPYEKGKGGVFLLNTGRARKTEPLVNLFLEKCSSQDFNRICDQDLLPVTHQCIDTFLKGDLNRLFGSFKKLSIFQRDHFGPMIPPLFKDVWQRGLESDEFYLKLCGAGGGGFLLGMTRDFSLIERTLSSYETRIVYKLDY